MEVAVPLKHDPDYQRELDAIVKISETQSHAYWATNVGGTAVALGGFLALAFWLKMDSQYVLPILIALLGFCVVQVIASGVRALHAVQMLHMGATEWIGRKQLGELE